ncbi:type VI secretion system amidase effector protein Tae4 [Paraherbaspirillum soli]|uniref:Type VI secretion system amidase effector protein Tae4 n=1 Tax=Paraherbaspirillum soli TaxID=631222 RepID=A0ABW0MDT7_9BURK
MPNTIPAAGRRSIPTNNIKGSVLTLHIQAITFQQLWDNYVTGNPYDDPAGTHKNQCAIRMSATLHRAGIDMKSFSQKVVKPAKGKATIGRILLNGKATSTRANEMAQWLSLRPFEGLPAKPEDITGADWEGKVAGRTGIIFFDGYWQQDGDSSDNLSGGHIDLWNGERLTISGFWGSFSTMGRYVGMQAMLPGTNFGWSDLGKSKKILFWEIP